MTQHPGQWPGIDEKETFEEVGTWSEAVDAEYIPFVYKKHQELNKLGSDTFKTWINKGRDHLYSIWREGCVPQAMFKRLSIKPELLDPLDYDTLVHKKRHTNSGTVKKVPPLYKIARSPSIPAS